jgi:hypothetical protein
MRLGKDINIITGNGGESEYFSEVLEGSDMTVREVKP